MGGNDRFHTKSIKLSQLIFNNASFPDFEYICFVMTEEDFGTLGNSITFLDYVFLLDDIKNNLLNATTSIRNL